MKKQYSNSIILVVLICIAAFFIINKNRKSNIKLPTFSVSDTTIIDLIQISNKEQVTISKQNGIWLVNNKYEARKELVDLALKTLTQISIKEPISKSSIEKINNNINSNSTKIEFLSKNKLIKTLYIGTPTKDSLGTYAKVDNINTPFITEIPGFNGHLSKRFPHEEKAWRTRSTLRLLIKNIQLIKLDNYLSPQESFTIEHNNQQFQIFNSLQQKIQNPNKEELLTYLKEFQNKNYLQTVNTNKKQIEEILNQKPIFEINIVQITGTNQNLKFFRKPISGKKDFFGVAMSYDPNQCYIYVDNTELVTATYTEYSPLFKKLSQLTHQP